VRNTGKSRSRRSGGSACPSRWPESAPSRIRSAHSEIMSAADEARRLRSGDPLIEVLVTGGAGFIGSNFVRWALDAHPDWRVTTLDKLTYAGRFENLAGVIDDPRHTFVRGDVADAAVAAPLVKAAEIVVHFAAETHVDRSILSAGEF